MDQGEERALVQRASLGDRAAAERLVRAHQGSLYAYIYRLSGKADLAEDITQEAFVRVFTHIDRFDPHYRFSTWLFTIARRLLINELRRSRAGAGGALDVVAEVGNQPAEAIEDQESAGLQRDALQRALLRLKPVQREVLLLFHRHEWAVSEIARYLSIPEGTVKSHLHRARHRMRRLIEDEQRCESGPSEEVCRESK